MARLKSTETIREFDFETLLVVVSWNEKGGRQIRGYLKSPRTGLATDVELFGDEERLAALLDDLAESLEIVKDLQDASGQPS